MTYSDNELVDFYQYSNENKMDFITKLKSALVSGVLAAVLAGAGYFLQVGDIFAIDVRTLVNVVALAGLTAVVSLIKSLATTEEGKFVGAVKIQ